jgi:hypothetical protein
MKSDFSRRVARLARSLGRRPAPSAADRPPFRPELLCLEERALPSTLTVTNLNDSGVGSLRYELAQAQNGDVITFAKGLQGTITLTSGEFQVAHSVTVQGPGANLLSVSGDDTSRVFEILGGASAFVTGLTVTGGVANPEGSGSLVGVGGGIAVDRGAALVLLDSTVTGNTANAASATGGTSGVVSGSGGGIYNAGTLTLFDDLIQGNTANTGSATGVSFGQVDGAGGGVYNAGSLTAASTTIDDNTANAGASSFLSGGEGGGIYSSGSLSLNGVTVSRDTASAGPVSAVPFGVATGEGGGLFIDAGTAAVAVSSFANDTANAANAAADPVSGSADVQGRGGAIYTQAGLTVSNSVFTGDVANAGSASGGGGARAAGYGGAIDSNFGQLSVANSRLVADTANAGSAAMIEAGGGGIDDLSALVLTQSFVASNTANSGSGASELFANGGGISAAGGTITNSVVAFNTVNASSGIPDMFVSGGGIYDTGSMTVTDSSVTFNNANANPSSGQGMGLNPSTATGGGIEVAGATAVLTLDSSSVAGNFALNAPSDIHVSGGGLVNPASANNLIGTGGSGGLINGVNGNVVL